ncbi:helix-turn-helix and ligand-binding sensor domain-containing protein [Robertkochia marina]|nr:triple tyrosine motif-containing protein [Robertkochia marina]
MEEMDNGILLFGNNEGVLIWDGAEWETVVLPNFSSVRSLGLDHKGKVWVGGYNEVGTLEKDDKGEHHFKSMTAELGLTDSDLENLWQIIPFRNSLVLRYDRDLVVIKDNIAARIKARNFLFHAEKVHDRLLVQDLNHGIFELNEITLELELRISAKAIYDQSVKAILPGKSEREVVLITKEGGYFQADLSTGRVFKVLEVFDQEEIDQVNRAIQLQSGSYILATQGSKLVEIRPDNTVNRNFYLNPKIKNRTVENVYLDEEGDLWVLQNQGIDHISFDASYTQVLDNIPVYDVALNQGNIYTATNQGVFMLSLDSLYTGVSQKVHNLPGQAWSINKIDDHLLVGHNDGLFQIREDRAISVSKETGFWGICPVPGREDLYLGTTYSGFYKVHYKDGEFRIGERVSGFDESTRDVSPSLTDPFTFWVCHGYKGVFRVKFDKNYSRVISTEFFTVYNGLESPFNIMPRTFEDQLIFTTNTGVFTFDEEGHKFVEDPDLNKILNPKKNTTLLKSAFDKIWFVNGNELGYYLKEDADASLHTMAFAPLSNSFVKSMESLLPLTKDLVAVGTINGLYLFDIRSRVEKSGVMSKTMINRVGLEKKNGYQMLPLKPEKPLVIGNNPLGSLAFHVANPKLGTRSKVYFSHFLEGSDEDWSAWSNDPEITFTGLDSGDYTLKVKSRNAEGDLGESVSYAFVLSPAWYETAFWQGVLILLFTGLVLGLRTLVIKRIRKEQLIAEKKVKHTRKMMQLEMEKYKLTAKQREMEREKIFLEQNVIDKSKELANYTLLLSKRKELFNEIYKDLQELRLKVQKPASKKAINSVFRKLESSRIGEKYLEIFDVNFERVHQDFFSRLKSINPNLSKKEEQLCALIKMDLTNKEIAPIMNLSLRGVESARYRLRKKLGITHEDGLRDFLETFTHADMEKSQ